MMNVKIKFLDKNAKMPTRATEGSAGYDLYANIKEAIVLKPGESVKIPTGIAIELPSNEYAAYIYGRSGLGVKHRITLSNCVGVGDSDYRGEIFAFLSNESKTDYTIQPYDRVAQMVFAPIILADFQVVNELEKTLRGDGGYGSTGK